MQRVVEYVREHPNCPKLWPAEHVGPSRFYGYRTVNRAIKAGLIVAQQRGNRYALLVDHMRGVS